MNTINKSARANNTSGTTGVYWNKKASKWRAFISFNKTTKHLGSFDIFDDAIKVRKAAESAYSILRSLGATEITVTKYKANNTPMISAIIAKNRSEPLEIFITGGK